MARSPLGRQQGVEGLRADPDAAGFLLRLYSSGLWSQEPKDRGAHTICIFPKRPSVYQWLSPAIALGAPSFVLPFPLQSLLFGVSRTGGWERRKKIHKTLLKKLRNIKIFSSHGMNTGCLLQKPQSFSKTFGARCIMEFRFGDSGLGQHPIVKPIQVSVAKHDQSHQKGKSKGHKQPLIICSGLSPNEFRSREVWANQFFKKKNPLIFKAFQILELWKKNYGLALFFVFYKNNSVPLPYPNSHQKEGGKKAVSCF